MDAATGRSARRADAAACHARRAAGVLVGMQRERRRCQCPTRQLTAAPTHESRFSHTGLLRKDRLIRTLRQRSQQPSRGPRSPGGADTRCWASPRAAALGAGFRPPSPAVAAPKADRCCTRGQRLRRGKGGQVDGLGSAGTWFAREWDDGQGGACEVLDLTADDG
jgi:hypothetical protein